MRFRRTFIFVDLTGFTAFTRERGAAEAAGECARRPGAGDVELVLDVPDDLPRILGDATKIKVVLKNRNTAYLFARTAGQTNVFFLNEAGQQILQLDLEVTPLLDQLHLFDGKYSVLI